MNPFRAKAMQTTEPVTYTSLEQVQRARTRLAEARRSALAISTLFAEWVKEDDAMTPEECPARSKGSRAEAGEEPIN